MEQFLKKLDPILTKITTEVHMLAVRDALISVVPFLFVGGIATFFAFVGFSEGGLFSGFMDSATLAGVQTFFARVQTATQGLLSLYLAVMIPYFLGNAKNYDNPLALGLTGLATFIIFTPLAGTYAYFGTQGVLLAIILGLTSAELFMRLSKVKALHFNLGGNIPAVVSRSFGNIFVICIVLVVFALVAAAINLLSGLETIEWIYSVLQAPLVGIGASIPGAILYYVIGGLFFCLGIQPSGIQAPIEAAMLAGVDMGVIFNQPFHYVYCNYGGMGAAASLVICLLLFSRRKEHRSIGKLVVFPELFNISEPIMFGLPVVFNFIFLVPMILVPIIDMLIAYGLTAAGILPVLSNVVVWSVPPFINGFIASNGSMAVVVTQVCLLVLDVFLWLPFLKIYERRLDAEDAARAAVTGEVTDVVGVETDAPTGPADLTPAS